MSDLGPNFSQSVRKKMYEQLENLRGLFKHPPARRGLCCHMQKKNMLMMKHVDDICRNGYQLTHHLDSAEHVLLIHWDEF